MVAGVVALPQSTSVILSPLSMQQHATVERTVQKDMAQEVFGFAPYWTLHKLANVDFSTLTTLAYFDVPVAETGHFDTGDDGYIRFQSAQATALFDKAHANNVRVILTLTQMDNATIKAFLDDPAAQRTMIDETLAILKEKKLDGVNIDFEYVGNPGLGYKQKFSSFVSTLTRDMHRRLIGSYVSVSVYAASAKEQRLYDMTFLGASADGIFMMAYDFATTTATTAMPTAPLYGHKEGEYWYDIATAVEDFTKVMPAEKIILGVPYYGYNYAVAKPEPQATAYPRSWSGKSFAQTYEMIQEVVEGEDGVLAVKTGWDDVGKVSWKAYKTAYGWRMVFVEDEQSLAQKYDFIKAKQLGGVGIWALGFDNNRTELWNLLVQKFGKNVSLTSMKRARS